ncbi:MAG: acyl--CoA ligase, partial [Gemmatimonadetes bacterium]|nr:acyl--CoA ligase [Gemmatimonadota bacterium]
MSTEQDLCGLLRRQAEVTPDKLFLRFSDGDSTYREFRDAVETRAGALKRALGDVLIPGSPGDEANPVVLPALLPNCREAVELWFAASRLGWTWAPINTEFRGRGLSHAINLTRSPVLIVDEALLSNVLNVLDELDHLTTLVIRGSAATTPPSAAARLRSIELDRLRPAPDRVGPAPTAPERTALLLYTSGTTGPSKACRLSTRYVEGQGALMARCLGIEASDVLFCPY